MAKSTIAAKVNTVPNLVGSSSATFISAIVWGFDAFLSLIAGLVVVGCAMYVVSRR
ncbi:MAG: hypothetical protein ACR2O1_17145 [Boseongicola sp.]